MTPALLFYCQHSLGMGHLVRSLAVASGLAAHFRVVFLNGGPLPKGLRRPQGVEIIALPPLGLSGDGHLLVSRDGGSTVDKAQQRRRRVILDTFHAVRPRVVLIELFPFGRKKFADELLPLLEVARTAASPRSLILCSLRDILVGRRPDQQQHDERASALANRYFDGVLVHADPAFARLEESFRPRSPLRIPVHYTGFVTNDNAGDAPGQQRISRRRPPIVVSAGGGLVGEPLFRAALEAHALLWPTEHTPMKIIGGPFLPEEAWHSLRVAGQGRRGLQLLRYVPDLRAVLRRAAASVSQCGYNTALDILRAGVPALVVPFAEGIEDEQMTRARRLERLGALRVLDSRRLDGSTLAAEIRVLLRFRPSRVNVDLDGVRTTAHLVATLSGLVGSEVWPAASGASR
jgi:predicted glycosyltransferase